MKIKNAIMLVMAALIWGTGFVAQSLGNGYVGPFTFNGVRNLIASVVLIPCIWLLQKIKEKNQTELEEEKQPEDKKTLLIGGICCGLALFFASSMQQIGICYTTVGKAGFITACYIVIVPILGIFLKKKVSKKVWVAVVLAVVGLYFLCITEKFTIGKGDIYIFICAVLFSVHIIVIDHFAPKVDGVKLSCIQFFVAGIISLLPIFGFEHPQLADIIKSAGPILYAAVMSSGVAYTLQIVGQKGVNPTLASLLLSLESCFSVLAGWVFLHQVLSAREAFGCVVMFAAVILAQLPDWEEIRDFCKLTQMKEG